MATSDDDSENGDVSWIYAGNSRSLRQRFRTKFLQFFTALKSDCCALIIVEPLRYIKFFVFFCLICQFMLLLYVRCILTHNINFVFNERLRIPRGDGHISFRQAVC